MNFPLKTLLLVLAGTCASLEFSASGQGSLTPPPGAPTATMKSLDQIFTNITQVATNVNHLTNQVSQLSNQVVQISQDVGQTEPRYPISTFGTNLTIAGSYYLVTNIFSGTNVLNDGINIRTNFGNMTIDLNGFAIINTNPASPSSTVGIRLSGATNVVIRNGQIVGFDRAVRIESPFYGILVEDLHAHKCTRAGIEGDGSSANPTSAFTVRNCVVEGINATGEGGNAAADGIVVLNCAAVVDNCVVRDVTPETGGASTCINALSATNTFVNNNYLSGADTGLRISGGGTNRVIYRNNLTVGCGTPFSVSGGVDRGGNF